MSPLSGVLKVSLISDVAEFHAGFDSATKRVEKFGKDIGRLGTLAAAGATAVLGGAIAIATQTARAGDEINKLSQRTGVSVEALSRLKYAAELNDATIADLEGAFRGLSARMLQAQAGTGEAAAAFGALGIKTVDADGALRKMDAVLLDVADAFATSNDVTAKAAVAQQLFGDAGVKLIPTLEQGRAGIEALGDEADRLGVTFTQETADAASELQDNLSRLDSAATGLKQTIGNALIPTVSELAEEFLDAQAAGLGFWQSLIRLGLSNPFDDWADKVTDTKRKIQETIADIQRPGASDSYRAARLNELEMLQKELVYYQARVKATEKATEATKDEAEATGTLTNIAKNLADQRERERAAKEAANKAAAEERRLAAETKRAVAELASEREKEIEAAAEGVRTIADQIKAKREENEEIGLSERAIAELRYTRLQHVAAQLEERANTLAMLDPNSQLIDLYREQAKGLRELAEVQQSGDIAQANADAARAAGEAWSQTAEGIRDDITDALIRGFEEGKGIAENFRDTLVNIFKSLVLRPAIQWAVSGALGAIGLGPATAGASGLGGIGGAGTGLAGFNPLSFIGGNSIGMGFSNIATGIAGLPGISGSGFGNMLTGMSGNMAGIPNWQYGIAGLAGGLGANLLFGGEGYSGLGGSFGSTIGMAIAGPIGAAVGTVLGGFVGSLFGGSGERFPRTVSSSMGRYEDGRFTNLGEDPDWFPGEDQFGTGIDRALNKLNKAFSERLGGLLEAFDIDADIDVGSRTRLRRTSGSLIAELFGSVNGQDFTTGGDGSRLQFGEDAEIEEAFAEFVETAMTQGLAAAIQASPLADNIKQIFAEELSGEEIDAAVDTLIGVATLKGKLEGMPAIFGKLSSSIDDVLQSDNFDDFSESAAGLAELQAATQVFYDGFTSGADKFRDAQRSLLYEFDELGVAMPQSIADFYRLADGIDVSTEEGAELYKQLAALAPAFLTVASAVEEVFDSISRSTASTIEQFTLDTLSDRQKYAYYDQQIASTIAELENAFDPATISQLYQEANADLQAAWNLLSDTEKARLRNEFVARALELEEIAQAQLSVTPPDLAPVIEDQAAAIGTAVETAVERAMSAAADKIQAASTDQAAAAEALRQAVREITVNVRLSGSGGGEVVYA